MALKHARHAQLLGLIAPMALARPVAVALGAPRPSGEERATTVRVGLVVSLVAALALALVRVAAPVERVDGPGAPISALGAVPPDLRSKPRAQRL